MKLFKYLLNYNRSQFILAIAISVAAGICNAGVIAIIDRMLHGRSHGGSIMILFVAILILSNLMKVTSQFLLTRLSQEAMYGLLLALVRSILKSPFRHLEKIGKHRLQAVLTTDIEAITTGVMVVPGFAVNFLVVLACLCYLGWLSFWTLTGVVLCVAAGLLIYRMISPWGMRWFQLARKDVDTLFKHLRSLTEGIKELKLHHQRGISIVRDHMEPAASSFRRHNLVAQLMFTVLSSTIDLIYFGMIGALLYWGPRLLHDTPAVLAGYIVILIYMIGPLDFLSGVGPRLGRAMVSYHNVSQLKLSLNPEPFAENVVEGYFGDFQELRLRTVTHHYDANGSDDEGFFLGPVSLTVRPGELHFVTGGNGSGKTTLGKIITGLYSHEGGQILLNGSPIDDNNRGLYSQYFAAVFSDCYVFDTLLGLDLPDLQKQAEDYLVRLRLDHKVQIRERKLSTIDLSQGQRKRLALLTTWLEDRPIYFFDEWAADQDPVFKDLFYFTFLPELKKKGKAVIVITHDDRYFDVADQIIRLEDGKCVSTPVLSMDAKELIMRGKTD